MNPSKNVSQSLLDAFLGDLRRSQEARMSERHTVGPYADYDDGSTGLAVPGILMEPYRASERMLRTDQLSQALMGDENAMDQSVIDSLMAAGSVAGPGSLASKPANSVGMFGLFKKKAAPEAPDTERLMREFVRYQRGDTAVPGAGPKYPDGREVTAYDFPEDALAAEFKRQESLDSVVSAGTPRVERKPPPTMPDNSPLPEDYKSYITPADRDAVLRARSEYNRRLATPVQPRSSPSISRMPPARSPQVSAQPAPSPAAQASAQPPLQAGSSAPSVVSPQNQGLARPSPVPKDPNYTKAHSKLTEKLFTEDPELALVAPNLPNRISAETDLSGIITYLQDQYVKAGLDVPSASNLERRLRGTFAELRKLRKAGSDISNPTVAGAAFGKGKNRLAVPGAIGGGSVLDSFVSDEGGQF